MASTNQSPTSNTKPFTGQAQPIKPADVSGRIPCLVTGDIKEYTRWVHPDKIPQAIEEAIARRERIRNIQHGIDSGEVPPLPEKAKPIRSESGTFMVIHIQTGRAFTGTNFAGRAFGISDSQVYASCTKGYKAQGHLFRWATAEEVATINRGEWVAIPSQDED